MKDRYTTIVLGATYYGLGYASSHPDCLILEEFQTVGGDFHHCLHPVRMDGVDENAKSSEMGSIMRQYAVWKDDFFDMLKAQAVVHEYVARKITEGMEILLDARILYVAKGKAGVTVTFITGEGIAEVTAENLVDATVDCISAPKMVHCTAKSLNIFTVAMTEDFDQRLRDACDVCCILDGPKENEKLIQFCCDVEEEMMQVYLKIMDCWNKAFPNGEEKILFVADTFDARYEPTHEKPEAWVGQRFANPIVAFTKGAMAE